MGGCLGGGGLLVVLVGDGDAGRRAVGVAQDAVDVVAAAVDVQGVEVVPAAHVVDAEAGRVAGAAVGSDQVGGEGAGVVELDRGLLVGVGIELDAALLGDDRRVVPFRAEREAGEVSVHEGGPPGSDKSAWSR
ncbi:hypothetical protein SGLAM104S_09190 [Streptomyces glaucescens]